MSEGDIRAGGAYVELGAKDTGLSTALSAAAKQVGALGENIASLGKKMAVIGALATTPIIAAAKGFADYGVEISKMAARTGFSTETLSGLGKKAETVALGVKGMQLAIANGSSTASAAFARLGTSAVELQKLSPEKQFGLLADRISQIQNPAERAATAMQVFGRAGIQLLPVLEKGSAGLNQMVQDSQRFGLVLDKGAIANAEKLHSALRQLGQAFQGFHTQVGAAAASALAPFIEKMADVISRVTEYVRKNPEVIQQVLKLGVEFVALGTTLYAVVKTLSIIATMFQSSFLIGVGVVVALGAATLAVLDVLGETDTGFGDLFNSIRVGGTGLGTWMAALWNMLAAGWNDLTTNLSVAWDSLWVGMKGVGRNFYSAFLEIVEKIVGAFEIISDGAAAAFNAVIEAYNGLAEKIGADPIKFRAEGGQMWGDLAQNLRLKRAQNNSDTADEQAGLAGRIDSAGARKAAADRAYAAATANAFKKDPQDGSSGVRLDLDRAKAALGKIGGNIDSALSGLLGGIINKIQAALPAPVANTANPFGDGSKGGGISFGSPERVLGAGSFSGFAAGTAATGLFQAQLSEQKKQSELLGQIAQNTADGGGLGA